MFDAEPPFRPGGAPAQAWSIAELIQALAVDLLDNPKETTRRDRKPLALPGPEPRQ